jgi:hypothetical protein
MIGLGKNISGAVQANAVATQLPGCVLWLRSDLGIGLLNNKVISWLDQSGRNNHATVAASSNGPTITKAALNGNDVLTFANASSNAMIIPYGNGDLIPQSNGFSLFIIWAWTDSSGATNRQIIGTQSSPAWSNNWGFCNGPTGNPGDIEFFQGSYITGTHHLGLTGYTNNNYHYSICTYNFVDTINFYIDGVKNTQATNSTWVQSLPSQCVIGNYTQAGGTGAPNATAYVNANIGEIGIWNRALSSVEAEQLHQYAKNRYSVL